MTLEVKMFVWYALFFSNGNKYVKRGVAVTVINMENVYIGHQYAWLVICLQLLIFQMQSYIKTIESSGSKWWSKGRSLNPILKSVFFYLPSFRRYHALHTKCIKYTSTKTDVGLLRLKTVRLIKVIDLKSEFSLYLLLLGASTPYRMGTNSTRKSYRLILLDGKL